jgi:hypothetical protein
VAEALAHPLTQQEQSTIEQVLVAEEALVPKEAEP